MRILLVFPGQNPDPPNLAFLEKARVFPRKGKGFSLRGTPKIVGKGRKNARKARKIGKRKKQGNRKKQGLEGQGRHSEFTNAPQIREPACESAFAGATHEKHTPNSEQLFFHEIHPDPRFPCFFDFLAFFFFRFSLLSLACFLPFPRILGVPRREKPLPFFLKKKTKKPCFSKKARFGVFVTSFAGRTPDQHKFGMLFMGGRPP